MTYRTRLSLGIVLVALLSSCSISRPPSTPAAEIEDLRSLPSEAALASPPAWVMDPAEFPPGRIGSNNCTFAFGQIVPQWNFHPDAGCWERPGPEGWTRQQQHRIHVPNFAACGGGPGDVSPIRVCRQGGAGQPSPCLVNPTTGPNGCAVCVKAFVCH